MAARHPAAPSAAELRDQVAARRGLKTDARNTRRRARYRELHPRSCECGADLSATWSRRCPPCQASHEAELRHAKRSCRDCSEDLTGTRQQRCGWHQLLREDEVRQARNARRRARRLTQ